MADWAPEKGLFAYAQGHSSSPVSTQRPFGNVLAAVSAASGLVVRLQALSPKVEPSELAEASSTRWPFQGLANVAFLFSGKCRCE